MYNIVIFINENIYIYMIIHIYTHKKYITYNIT